MPNRLTLIPQLALFSERVEWIDPATRQVVLTTGQDEAEPTAASDENGGALDGVDSTAEPSKEEPAI